MLERTAKQLLEISSGALVRYFSTRVLRDLAAPSGGEVFRTMAEKDGLFGMLPLQATLEEFYDAALITLIRQDRSEYVYKNAIAQKILFGRHSVRTTALLFEFKAGRSKLDALLLNGSSNAYEIKTSKDELRRLETQIPDYQERFAHVWVLSSERHLQRLKAILPREIGIAVLSERYRISTIRKAERRVRFLRSQAMFESMRREEYLRVLDEFGSSIAAGDVPNTLIYRHAKECFEKYPARRVHDAMVRELKARFQFTNVHAATLLPRSLTAAGIGLNVSGPQLSRLNERLRIPISKLEIA